MRSAFHSRKFRKFTIWFSGQDYPVFVRATDEKSLGWFLKQEYKVEFIDYIDEQIAATESIDLESVLN